jgi:hypothetical protein
MDSEGAKQRRAESVDSVGSTTGRVMHDCSAVVLSSSHPQPTVHSVASTQL